jgi:hypothetical protein
LTRDPEGFVHESVALVWLKPDTASQVGGKGWVVPITGVLNSDCPEPFHEETAKQ